MKKKEVLSLIFLANKDKENISSILLDLSSSKKITGKMDKSNFVYTIDKEEYVIPRTRLWQSLISEAVGKTEKAYLESIAGLVKKYNYPEDLLKYSTYVNPEDNFVKNYVTKDVIF